jgi:hypothetical protein
MLKVGDPLPVQAGDHHFLFYTIAAKDAEMGL